MKKIILIILLLIIPTFLSCSCKRLYYKPNLEESSLPQFVSIKPINSLKTIDFKTTHSKNDIYPIALSKRNKERNYLKHNNAVYYFYLFENNSLSASSYQESRNNPHLSNVYLEKMIDDNSLYFIEFTERPKACPGAFCIAYDYYESTATFKLQNLVVHLFIRHKTKVSNDLMNEISFFSKLIRDHFL